MARICWEPVLRVQGCILCAVRPGITVSVLTAERSPLSRFRNKSSKNRTVSVLKHVCLSIDLSVFINGSFSSGWQESRQCGPVPNALKHLATPQQGDKAVRLLDGFWKEKARDPLGALLQSSAPLLGTLSFFHRKGPHMLFGSS